jgi:sucrose phosphorylase
MLGNQGIFFNFIASHDGIGILPAEGILSEDDMHSLVGHTLAHGGQVSYKSNPDGTQSPYELNITLYDALSNPARPNPSQDIERFIASQVIMLSLAGVPGIYIHSLFGSRNDHAGVNTTGQARSINREKFDFDTLQRRLSKPESREARILSKYTHLLNVRRGQVAFHPLAVQEIISPDPAVFSIVRRSQDGKQTILCLVNVTPLARQLCLDLQACGLASISTWQDLIDRQSYSATSSGLKIDLKPYQACWLSAS